MTDGAFARTPPNMSLLGILHSTSNYRHHSCAIHSKSSLHCSISAKFVGMATSMTQHIAMQHSVENLWYQSIIAGQRA